MCPGGKCPGGIMYVLGVSVQGVHVRVGVLSCHHNLLNRYTLPCCTAVYCTLREGVEYRTEFVENASDLQNKTLHL